MQSLAGPEPVLQWCYNSAERPSYLAGMRPFPMTQLIHENFSIVMTFAFSRRPLERMVQARFSGEWKYLNKALFDVSEMRAQRACLEFAILLRQLDDDDPMSEGMKKGDPDGYGDLIALDGSTRRLTLRDVCNKIIHAASLTWDWSKPDWPVLICEAQERQDWQRAEIHWVQVAAACGNIMA